MASEKRIRVGKRLISWFGAEPFSSRQCFVLPSLVTGQFASRGRDRLNLAEARQTSSRLDLQGDTDTIRQKCPPREPLGSVAITPISRVSGVHQVPAEHNGKRLKVRDPLQAGI